MSQNTAAATAATSLGGGPPRHRHRDSQAPHEGGGGVGGVGGGGGVGGIMVGTSASARYGESEWEAREVCSLILVYIHLTI